MPNSNDPDGMPTGPLSDHEIAVCLIYPPHFTMHRAATEIVKWRSFCALADEAIRSNPDTALARIALALEGIRQ